MAPAYQNETNISLEPLEDLAIRDVFTVTVTLTRASVQKNRERKGPRSTITLAENHAPHRIFKKPFIDEDYE
jgi:hypothetical protein